MLRVYIQDGDRLVVFSRHPEERRAHRRRQANPVEDAAPLPAPPSTAPATPLSLWGGAAVPAFPCPPFLFTVVRPVPGFAQPVGTTSPWPGPGRRLPRELAREEFDGQVGLFPWQRRRGHTALSAPDMDTWTPSFTAVRGPPHPPRPPPAVAPARRQRPRAWTDECGLCWPGGWTAGPLPSPGTGGHEVPGPWVGSALAGTGFACGNSL